MKKVLTVVSLFLFMAFLGGVISVTVFENSFAGGYDPDCHFNITTCEGTCDVGPFLKMVCCEDDICPGENEYVLFEVYKCSNGLAICDYSEVGCWEDDFGMCEE